MSDERTKQYVHDDVNVVEVKSNKKKYQHMQASHNKLESRGIEQTTNKIILKTLSRLESKEGAYVTLGNTRTHFRNRF